EIPLSAVLKERLTEAETKMAALEKENAILKMENQNLRVDFTKAQEEIGRLKQPQKLQSAWGSGPRIPGRMG
ncbi:MAG: hypothetical protein NT154_06865, partial [Verrucomicrobia bacterium]|nr:hypothetical protein [Verrucomicrobiota bacterium]